MLYLSQRPDEGNDPAYHCPSQEDVQQDNPGGTGMLPNDGDNGRYQVNDYSEKAEFPHTSRLAKR